MDTGQQIIIVLLSFIATLLLCIVNPSVKEYIGYFPVVYIAGVVAWSILAVIFGMLQDAYWGVRKFVDRARGRLRDY